MAARKLPSLDNGDSFNQGFSLVEKFSLVGFLSLRQSEFLKSLDLWNEWNHAIH